VIVEPVVCVILHCSRCNTPYLDSETDAPAHWDGLTRIADVFRMARQDVNGWRRTSSDERYLCEVCHIVEGAEAVEKPPLPAIDEALVIRAQSEYARQVTQVVAYALAPPVLAKEMP
jgi:hypothetical protein